MPQSSPKETDSTFKIHNTSDKCTERPTLRAVQLEQISSSDKFMDVDTWRFAYAIHLLPLLFSRALSQTPDLPLAL